MAQESEDDKIRCDEMEQYSILEETVKQNIDYDVLLQSYPDEVQLVQGIYELIVETVAYTGKKLVIASNELPTEFVKNRFMKLNFMHIQYVISSMKKNTTEIKNIKKYLLAALYNAPATMQGYYGGLYASNFNRFGKMYRVMVQADPALRTNLESLKNIKVRNGNEMAPISQFVSIKKVYGPDIISRFNMYTSIKVMVAPADGYTSGQALKAIEEVAGTTLPTGFGYELGGMAREEAETSGSTTGLIFLLCFVFVYLLLSAQYESYILPLAVLLSIPFGLMGSFLFVQGWAALGNIPALKMILGTMSNNIYMQIALIMLVGLLAKNAILIVEFALDRRRMGMSITWAAVLGAAARLRPILMTSLAMVVGLLPMMFAFGVGAHGNRTLGTAAIGGMFIGMIFQIFIVPVLFVVFQYLQEKFKPIEWEDLDNSDMNTEIEQYAKTK